VFAHLEKCIRISSDPLDTGSDPKEYTFHSWRYAILKKIKNWKIGGKILHLINEFMKDRTLRVAIRSTFSEEKQIENGVVQGVVLKVTLFLVAMAEITHGNEELIKIISYADGWIVHITHKHERVCVLRLKKAMEKIGRWTDDTGFQKISIEKTKAILFSHKTTAIGVQAKRT
jgi:hypothetical protein